MKQLYKQWHEDFPVEVRGVWFGRSKGKPPVPHLMGSLNPPPEEAPILRTMKDETIHLSIEDLA